MASVVIIIPCYNEKNRLPLEEFTAFLTSQPDGVVLYFIDDGSTDGTIEILETLHRQFPQSTRYYRLDRNVGKAEAVRQGVLRSEDLNADYLGYFDADLATPLSQIGWMLNWNRDNRDPGLIMGARVNLFGSTTVTRYAFRHYSGRVFATLVSNMLGISIYDTQCGAKLFRSSLAKVLFGEPFISRWLFDVELIYRMIQHTGRGQAHLHMMEVPLQKWTEKGNTKVSFFYLFRVPFELLRIYYKYRMLRKKG